MFQKIALSTNPQWFHDKLPLCHSQCRKLEWKVRWCTLFVNLINLKNIKRKDNSARSNLLKWNSISRVALVPRVRRQNVLLSSQLETVIFVTFAMTPPEDLKFNLSLSNEFAYICTRRLLNFTAILVWHTIWKPNQTCEDYETATNIHFTCFYAKWSSQLERLMMTDNWLRRSKVKFWVRIRTWDIRLILSV